MSKLIVRGEEYTPKKETRVSLVVEGETLVEGNAIVSVLLDGERAHTAIIGKMSHTDIVQAITRLIEATCEVLDITLLQLVTRVERMLAQIAIEEVENDEDPGCES